MKNLIKWLFKSLIIALIIIFSVNLIGSFFEINIPLNIWTLLIVTIFRIPGAIVLIIFFLL
ncbi:MAG TPA: hypothetical protein GXZ48_03470 [Acholeplasmataceae bacterium]|nr:hypothetical protein [Acholeplasmataceae bacterium]